MKKTWAIGLCSILLTILAVTFTVKLQKRIILNETKINLFNLAVSVEMDLERTLFGLNQIFLGLNNYLEDASTDEPTVRRIIDTILHENPLLTAIMVIAPDGQVLHWNNSYQKPNLSKRDYFKAFKEGYQKNLFIGSPQESILNKGQWIFGVSRAFRDNSGELTRVVSAIIDTNILNRLYQDIFKRSQTKLSIFSADGKIYVQIPGHKTHVGTLSPDLGIIQPQATRENEVRYNFGSDETKQLSIIRNIDQYPLFVRIQKSEQDIFAQWDAGLWIYYLFGSGICLTLLLLAYQTARSQQQQLEVNKQLQRQAISDSLTGLYNRRYILEQTRLELRKAERLETPLSVVMLDLDEFKQVNDNCGHDTGDSVLVDTAKLLKEHCRDTDMISRYGGEEFLLTLPGTDLSGALHTAEKIRQAMEEQVYPGPQGEFRVTGSFGVAQFNENEELEAGIKRADDALYQAKRKGRNQVVTAQHEAIAEKKESNLFWFHKRR